MIDKISGRLRSDKKTRFHIKALDSNRLSVFKSANHIYATVYTPTGDRVLATASSLDKELSKDVVHGGNIASAKAVGQLIAKRAQEKGIKTVAFDKSGYKYHGRIKALADAARESGMLF